MIDYAKLRALSEGLSLDTPSTSPFWNDPHISAGLLAAHLDEGTDAASRVRAKRELIVDWLERTALKPGARVLDLGCGPGLYAEALARRGHAVVGLDMSARSIAHARASAARAVLDIEYREGNYLADALDPEGLGFDAAIMIYCDLGALPHADRLALMRKVRACLRPDGAFCFDLFGPDMFARSVELRTWALNGPGFWSAAPHLVLEEHRKVAAERALLRCHIVAEADGGRVERYVFRDYCFDAAGVRALAREAGYASCAVAEGLLPPSDFAAGDPLFGAARA